MAFTQTQLEALEKAIAEGVLSVKYSDKMVTYRSQAEMFALRDVIRRELGLTKTSDQRRVASFSKGTNG